MTHELDGPMNAVAGPCAASHLDSGGTTARRQLLMADPVVREVSETFRVLGDPTRVRILDALAAGELCVCDIAALVGISESAVSHQLRLLRGMRLVRPPRSGRLVYYALDDQHIIELLRQAGTHVAERVGHDAAGAPGDTRSRAARL